MTTMSVDELDAIFRDSFPLREGGCSLEYVSIAATDDPGSHRLTLRLVVWDERPDGTMSIEDIKEQELHCVTYGSDRARIDTFLKAYDHVVGLVFTHSRETVKMLMPHDLFSMTALKLAKTRTKEEFEEALAKKSRLGRFLPENLRSSSSSNETPPKSVTMTPDELDSIFRDKFPLRGGTGSLEYVSVAATDVPNAFRVVMRLVMWVEKSDGTLTIDDVKEQELYCGTFGADRARLETFLDAYAYVLGLVFTHSRQ